MDNFLLIVSIIGTFGTIISIVIGIIYLNEFLISRRIERLTKDTIPIKIKHSISNTQLWIGLRNILKILDEDRFKPDLIIGIHYTGTSIAALLAKELFIPFYTAVIHYYHSKGSHVCNGVTFTFDLNKYINGKKVLIVDNGAITGLTLKCVYDEIEKHTTNIKTVILFQKSNNPLNHINPDYIIFQSDKKIRLLKGV